VNNVGRFRASECVAQRCPIYLFTLGLFNDAFNSTDYIMSNVSM